VSGKVGGSMPASRAQAKHCTPVGFADLTRQAIHVWKEARIWQD
jgi:hypothetical protein